MHHDLTMQEIQILRSASRAKSGQIALGTGDLRRLLDRRLMALGPGGDAYILPAGIAELKRRGLS